MIFDVKIGSLPGNLWVASLAAGQRLLTAFPDRGPRDQPSAGTCLKSARDGAALSRGWAEPAPLERPGTAGPVISPKEGVTEEGQTWKELTCRHHGQSPPHETFHTQTHTHTLKHIYIHKNTYTHTHTKTHIHTHPPNATDHTATWSFHLWVLVSTLRWGVPSAEGLRGMTSTDSSYFLLQSMSKL